MTLEFNDFEEVNDELQRLRVITTTQDTVIRLIIGHFELLHGKESRDALIKTIRESGSKPVSEDVPDNEATRRLRSIAEEHLSSYF